MAEQKQDDQLEHTYSSYVRIRDVALKTCQRQGTIGRSGERGSEVSVLAARHNDDNVVWLGWVGFYGISTIGGYLMPNPHMIWFSWVLWHIKHCKLFNAKSSLYIYIKYLICKYFVDNISKRFGAVFFFFFF